MVRHFRCFSTDINVGLKYSRADIFGVRDVGGSLSGDIESIIIEVKRGNEPFATASGQALGYSVYANRVYLADRRDSGFRQDELQIASRLGIGLIRIARERIDEVLSSPHHQPITRMSMEILEKIRLGQCCVCRIFFEIGPTKKKLRGHLAREDIRKAALNGKGLIFWSEKLFERKRKLKLLPHRQNMQDRSFERRMVCGECVAMLWRPIFHGRNR